MFETTQNAVIFLSCIAFLAEHYKANGIRVMWLRAERDLTSEIFH